ncbi:MAG: hypothetical protein QF464_14155, partial [Myxococcota bacterium]|nr:hypothetical protein [Myxococcota bacterium]
MNPRPWRLVLSALLLAGCGSSSDPGPSGTEDTVTIADTTTFNTMGDIVTSGDPDTPVAPDPDTTTGATPDADAESAAVDSTVTDPETGTDTTGSAGSDTPSVPDADAPVQADATTSTGDASPG